MGRGAGKRWMGVCPRRQPFQAVLPVRNAGTRTCAVARHHSGDRGGLAARNCSFHLLRAAASAPVESGLVPFQNAWNGFFDLLSRIATNAIRVTLRVPVLARTRVRALM